MIIEDAKASMRSKSGVAREIRTRTGHYLSVRWQCTSPAFDGTIGACVVINDVTSLRNSEAVARQNDLRIRLAEDLGQLAFVGLDETGRITQWGPGAVRLCQWSEEEALGVSCEMLYPSNASGSGPLSSYLGIARTHGCATLKQTLSRKDGTTFRAVGVVARIEAAEHTGFLQIFRHDSVLFEGRTVVLEQALGLRADAADRIKAHFLALMSHELKHPLNLILTSAELIRRLPEVVDLPSVLSAADTIREAAETQAKIFDNLLDLARLRTGELGLHLSVFALDAAVASVVESFDGQARDAGVDVQMDVEGAPLFMEGDRARVEQVVSNILGNALKFTPRGGHVLLHMVRMKSGQLQLVVRDSGQGITPDFRSQIFDAFSQEEGERRSEGGLGIGLSLVRDLVLAHSGEVGADSAGRGKGSSFTVRLPGISGRASDAESIEVSSSLLEGTRILLVDDSRKTIEVLANVLRLEGGKVDTAYSAADALVLLQSKPYDVLVSDLGMPEMSGYELMARIRRLDLRQAPIAIASSGYSQEADIERALSAGFDMHLSKPTSVSKLKAAIASLRPPAKAEMRPRQS